MNYNTKLQRKKIYQAILNQFEVCTGFYLCWGLEEFTDLNMEKAYRKMGELFPELYAQRPTINFQGSVWWMTETMDKKRIKALKAAIKLCEQ